MPRRLSMGACLLAVLAGTATAQDLVEPAAVEALQRMGAHLAGLGAFALDADTTMEVVLDTDQKLLIGGTANYRVRQPDRLRVELRTDVVHRDLLYDGRRAVVLSPEDGFYADIADVPPTIAELLERAAQRHGLAFPVADLLAWDGGDGLDGRISEGFRVGQARVGGVLTDHWAYRIDDQDLELWLPVEGSPLPRRISTVDRKDLTHPRFTTDLSWDETARPAEAEFTFAPADGMAPIPLAAAGPAQEVAE